MTGTTAPFRHTLRVYWEDTDAGGVVFYANYLKFFERARTEWLRRTGCSQEALRVERGVMFVVAETQVRYLRPARLDDLLTVSVKTAEAGRVGLVVEQAAWRIPEDHADLDGGAAGRAPGRPKPARVLSGDRSAYSPGEGSELLAQGRIRIACVDAGTFRPCRIPTDLLDALSVLP